jgi:carboxyl-terminal processing protease
MKQNKFPSQYIAIITAIITSIIIVVTLTIVLNSCSSFVPETEIKTANDYIYEKFQDWYLWYDKIPDIDPNGIKTQEALIDSIKVPQDRWSFSASLTTIDKLFQGGAYTGFGGAMVLDANNKIRIAYVYADSPFGKAGAQRGWEVKSVNGYTSNELDSVNSILSKKDSITFEFLDLNSTPKTAILTRKEIVMNTVLYSNIYPIDQHTIGYFVFDSFLETSEAELNTVITRFKDEKITDLIVDLRYNGGGLNDIAYKLIAMIGGSKVDNQVITMLKNNDKHSNKDSNKISGYKGTTLDLSRVFFITTSETASASELVINGLTPYMEVNLVGSHTHGKPVGMYVFEVKELDLAILPICFKTTNSLGYGEYFDGLPVNIDETDDISHNWGDTEEAMLKTTINAITQPAVSFQQSTLKSMNASLTRPIGYKGINQIVGAY